jgi:hypothetical protein
MRLSPDGAKIQLHIVINVVSCLNVTEEARSSVDEH